ncbi:MAG: A24 family peptidase [Nanoarchaeota archaeon]|nr:A24 family peptidase [Nanoarchaeota archaeon]MBU4242539.1 A24 family peptidase [Nanoarchaeota archaeon]MBU4351558.1 A24 family peptidase [Nanoarchaeota archaeon]
MLADILLIVVALIALLIASISDIKTKEVPDFVSFGLIAVALAIRLLYSLIFSEWSYFLYGLLGFGAMFAFGSLIYYTKQWGGGDAKLLMGLGAAFATTPFYLETSNIPFLIHMLTNLFIVGAVFGLISAFVLYLKNREATNKEFKKILIKAKNKIFIFLIVLLLMLIISIFLQGIYKIATIVLIGSIFIYLLLFFFIKAIEKIGMFKMIPVNKLTEGDWVAENIKIKNKLIYSKKSLGIEKYQIDQLKKAKIKKVLVKEGMAFVPSIAVGVILTLMIGNIWIWLV